jgi:hypothetical protein
VSIKKKLVGIVLSFAAVGGIATNTYEASYQKIYDEHETNKTEMLKIMESEFISDSDKSMLENQLTRFADVKDSDVKSKLTDLIELEQENIETVQQAIVKNEATVAKKEINVLQTELEKLTSKSEEPFILKEDALLIDKLQQVKPVREIAQEVDDLSIQLIDNQKQAKSSVEELKEFNKKLEDLSKHEYVLVPDKKLIKETQKENAELFDHVDDLQVVKDRQKESNQLVEKITTKIKDSEFDFKEHGPKVKELINLSNKLLSEGQLEDSEKEQLNSYVTVIKDTLEKKGYNPGDLKKHYERIQPEYETLLKNSQKRLAEAAEKAAAEAKRQAEETRKQEEEARKQAEQAVGPTMNGDWYQAPAGFKYLKVTSGKTYGQVKNPNNFSLITEAEAANYSPGHGNGSAKQ